MGVEVIPAPGDDLGRFVQVGNPGIVGIFLRPFQGALGSVYPDSETVVMAYSDLGTPVKAFGSAVIIYEDGRVVIQNSSLHEGVQPRGERLDLQAGQIGGHVLDMTSDIPNTVGYSCLLRVGSPGRLFLPGFFEESGQPVLRVLCVDKTDLSQVSFRNHFPQVFDDGIAGVGVGDAEEQIFFSGETFEFFRILAVCGQGFVTDDVDPVLERQLGYRKM